ncbi:PAS domain-containing protein [Sulfurimonas sediminis]|uniref:PAS domain-containing protein n=1 Tax=Sulfurimonas sediminis TaxID=2590020 RepID=A0A7M1AYQ6_9BACT|nr:PAS domain-containing protein [Sulfurimonas sediminis]QOP42580.1 PAS domain-containing protein [Sulfurimonas sediminis]
MTYKGLSKKDAPKNIKNIEKALNENDFIVSKTDLNGKIIYCNEIFTAMAGYPATDLIGANHNIIRHPDMPKVAFKILWDLLKAKKEFFGFVKNLSADGSYYWVFAYITPDFDTNNNVISYTSVRRQASPSAVQTIIPIYKLLIDAEKSGGIKASQAVLDDFLVQKNLSYDEFVINLQKGMQL